MRQVDCRQAPHRREFSAKSKRIRLAGIWNLFLGIKSSAVVDLGLCLDLTTSAGIEQVRSAFKEYSSLADGAEWSMPENSEDLLRRNLDCAVLQYLHKIREDAEKPEVDTVKGIFVEGNPIYKSAGFIDKTHVQICVRNPECIKGVFRVDKRFLS